MRRVRQLYKKHWSVIATQRAVNFYVNIRHSFSIPFIII